MQCQIPGLSSSFACGWLLHDDGKQQLTKSHHQTALPKLLAMTWDELIPDHPTSTKGDLGKHFRLLQQLNGLLFASSFNCWYCRSNFSKKTFGLLSLAAFFLPVLSEKGWRHRECSSQLSFHDNTQIPYGHPTDDDELSRDWTEASAWDPSRNKVPSDFLTKRDPRSHRFATIWVTRLHGKE